eukprot:TRINITY_DN9917_c0_g1_i1.p1 TRINITY_DN9917_c0_g1~~TRINITY_DN9917_c0_g1_i1.p1  ORF type:complete len:226 (+),score=32.76 TRINITY_DN9917_c0_g1_i1:1-678(+)
MWLHSIRTRKIEEAVKAGKIGKLQRVTAAFTFHYPNEEWLQGGNGRTDKTREQMGCFGDQGWYPVGAIMWAFNYELPVKVQATYVNLNKVDTITSLGGTIWFSGNRIATFDCGAESSHRAFFELSGSEGNIRVNDQVGGGGRVKGNFSAYFGPFVGSGSYTHGDVEGCDTIVKVEKCDHVIELVKDFVTCVKKGINPEWPKRSLAQHRVMVALFQSANSGKPVTL